MIQGNLWHVDEAIWVLTSPTRIAIYDFDFRNFFPTRFSMNCPPEALVIARAGAIHDYEEDYADLLEEGIQLIHSPEIHLRASRLPGWYPRIEELTPRTRWYDTWPATSVIEAEFSWPIFVKGVRQTSHHRRSLAIFEDAASFEAAREEYQSDETLSWQAIAVREYADLRIIETPIGDRLPSAYEFRTFWWKGQWVADGPYWWQGRPYMWTESERNEALTLAEEAARRVDVPFLAIDVAQTIEGRWIVVECNDAQESGFAGASVIGLWQNIIDIEKRK